MASAAVSISKLSAYGSLSIVLSIVLSVLVAPEVDPVKVSPAENLPETLATSRTFVSASQDLTLAVVLLVDPVIISLNAKFPVFDPPGGAATETVGATEYPAPAFVI